MTDIILRVATESDAQQLFDWVNLPETLAQKENTSEPIAWPDHQAWFRSRLLDAATLIMIIEKDGADIGQIRLEPCTAGVAIDIFIVEAARRCGNARKALVSAIAHTDVRPLIAIVKSTNHSSRRLFESVGFYPVQEESGVISYEFQDQSVNRNV